MSRESRLRLKLKSALDDIDRMEKGNFSQLLPRKKEEAFDLIIDLKNAWGISLEEILEDETDQTPRQLYDKLCAAKVREDRNDFATPREDASTTVMAVAPPVNVTLAPATREFPFDVDAPAPTSLDKPIIIDDD